MRRGLKWAASVALIVGLMIMPSLAQISVTSFTTSVPVATLNSILASLGANALNRTGGTITGNIAVNSGVTIDGVDISANLSGSGTPTFSTATVASSSASAIDVAGGINAGSGNVGIIDTSGRIPALSSTYLANLSGANLTGLSFAQLPTTWSSQAYSAGNYVGNGSLTWTVEAPDFVLSSYLVAGKTMLWNTYLVSTTTGGTTNTELRITLPGSATVGLSTAGSCACFPNGVAGTCAWVATAGNTFVQIYTGFGGNWTLSSNNNSLSCNFILSIA